MEAPLAPHRPAPPIAHRDSRYRRSLSAMSLIDASLEQKGILPTVRDIQERTGGSMRDAQRIHRLAREWLAQVVRLALTTHSVEKMGDLHDQLAQLQADNQKLSDSASRLESEYDGLRKHLLLETRRLRESLVRGAADTQSTDKASVVVKRFMVQEDAEIFDSNRE